MKNVLPLTNLVLVAGYPLLLAAGSLGLVSTEILSFPAFVGCFFAVNVLGIAFTSYGGTPRYDQPRARKAARQPVRSTQPVHAGWLYDTHSA